MTIKGRIQNGVVLLEDAPIVPDGTPVTVSFEADDTLQAATIEESFLHRYKDFVGLVDDLPQDSSINLDHYLYGAPKQ